MFWKNVFSALKIAVTAAVIGYIAFFGYIVIVTNERARLNNTDPTEELVWEVENQKVSLVERGEFYWPSWPTTPCIIVEIVPVETVVVTTTPIPTATTTPTPVVQPTATATLNPDKHTWIYEGIYAPENSKYWIEIYSPEGCLGENGCEVVIQSMKVEVEAKTLIDWIDVKVEDLKVIYARLHRGDTFIVNKNYQEDVTYHWFENPLKLDGYVIAYK